MTLFENDYIKISIDRTVPCLEWAAIRKMSSEEFRESELKLQELYLENINEFPELQLFVDARIVGMVSTEDTSWVAETILPSLSAAGLKKDAFLVPESALEKLIVRNFITKAGEEIKMKVFNTVSEAKDWLKI